MDENDWYDLFGAYISAAGVQTKVEDIEVHFDAPSPRMVVDYSTALLDNSKRTHGREEKTLDYRNHNKRLESGRRRCACSYCKGKAIQWNKPVVVSTMWAQLEPRIEKDDEPEAFLQELDAEYRRGQNVFAKNVAALKIADKEDFKAITDTSMLGYADINWGIAAYRRKMHRVQAAVFSSDDSKEIFEHVERYSSDALDILKEIEDQVEIMRDKITSKHVSKRSMRRQRREAYKSAVASAKSNIEMFTRATYIGTDKGAFYLSDRVNNFRNAFRRLCELAQTHGSVADIDIAHVRSVEKHFLVFVSFRVWWPDWLDDINEELSYYGFEADRVMYLGGQTVSICIGS